MIGQLNQFVTFSEYELTQGDDGAMVRTLTGGYTDWVKIEQRNGSRRLEEAQISFQKTYLITKRHYPERPVAPDTTEIIYNDAILSIHDVELLDEGRRQYEQILCYTNGRSVDGRS